MNNKKSPVVDVAKDISQDPTNNIIELPSGVRVMLSPVSAALIQAVSSRIKDPPVPIRFNEEKGRDEEYPLDPAYISALTEAANQRGVANMDAMYMFGIDLVDGLPESTKWLTQLRFLEKHGNLDLSEYDLEDQMDQEFLYKRFIVGSTDILMKITRLSGMTGEEVSEAESSFPGNA